MATINSINSNQLQFAISHADSKTRSVARQPGDGNTAGVSQKDLLPQSRSDDSLTALGQRHKINASLNDAAQSVRAADAAMKTINGHIDKMKSQLDVIVKHYPPFLSNDPTRIRSLRNFSVFRKEIDALTIPPQSRGAAQIMADPAVFPQAGSQEIALSNGGTGTLQGRQVHTGPAGLNIPSLSDASTDAEIKAARESLDAAQAILGKRQEGLSMDWTVIVPSGKYADAAAEKMSSELGRSLSQEPFHGFTGIRPLLSQLA